MGWIWARIKINVAQIWASSAYFGLFMADIGPSFGLLVAHIWQTGADRPSATILHSMWTGARCWIWAGSGPELKSMCPRFGPVVLYLVYSWLTLGLPLAYLWPKFGKQERTAQVPSFHAVCGPDESVRCGPDLDLRNFAIWGANHWYNPPHSLRTLLIQSEQKGWQNHSGPLTSSTLPL